MAELLPLSQCCALVIWSSCTSCLFLDSWCYIANDVSGLSKEKGLFMQSLVIGGPNVN